MRNRFVFVTAAVAVCAGFARASVITEVGDAGSIPSTAQIVPDAVFDGTPISLQGTLPVGSDVDMYRIKIDNPASFSASVVAHITSTIVADTQIFLFNSAGVGVVFDDNDPLASDGRSRITGQLVPAPGVYYLAVSFFDVDPVNIGNVELWNDSPNNVERAPDGPAADFAVDHWFGDVNKGAGYTITIIPAPSAVLPLLGLAALRRRRSRAH
jgi:hypothetical protein